jgi:hypothetical protein
MVVGGVNRASPSKYISPSKNVSPVREKKDDTPKMDE